eukprot:1384359-Rhodomonas_salina.1
MQKNVMEGVMSLPVPNLSHPHAERIAGPVLLRQSEIAKVVAAVVSGEADIGFLEWGSILKCQQALPPPPSISPAGR